ncbi:glutathione S-transferase family protein [Loktanella agnita]|uniref:glutathione S-transferase family protein n=1 Tax=Loktanella agnita TaxID=287097 RepID=UPI0039887A6D
MKLHYAPHTISVAVAIALEEVGTPYQAVHVDFAAAQQTTSTYHKINPKGRVPALETPDGILTETGALLEYVAPGLVPENAFAAGRMRELMYYLASTMHVNHAHKMRGSRWASAQSSFDDMAGKVAENMATSCAYLEEELEMLPFPSGNGQVVSDFYLYVVLSWLSGDGVDIADFPILQDFQHRMNTRRSVQAVFEKGML